MLVRLDPAVHPAFKRAFQTNAHEVAPLFRYLLTPVALLAYVLAGWRLGADMNWTGAFFISAGLLSHWQVWLAVAIATQAAAAHLAPGADKNEDLLVP
jgi:hypothetical protein